MDNTNEWVAQWWANKKKKEQSLFIQEQAKMKPLIKRTRYKRLSLGDVQTRDGILEIMCKL